MRTYQIIVLALLTSIGESVDTSEASPDGASAREEAVVLARFVPGSIALPPGVTELALADAVETPGVLTRHALGAELDAVGVVGLGHLIPTFDPTVVDRNGEPVTDADGHVLTVPHDLGLWYVLDLSHDRVEESCAILAESPDVEVAEPDWRRRANALPNDDYFDRQWGLRNTGQYGGVPGKDLNAEDAWDDFGAGLHPVRIAVLDTGMDFAHPDFHEVEVGVNLVTGGLPEDDSAGVWHGTAVAGIAGMKGNNGIGGTGVGWQLTIVPVKVLDAGGGGFDSWIAAGLDWTRSQGIKIANMSLGGEPFSSLVREVVRNGRAAGMTNVAAAGNYQPVSGGAHYPAAYGRHCLSVNAFMMNGDRWVDDSPVLLCGVESAVCGDRPDYEPCESYHGTTVDLTAPGGRAIFTTKHSVFDDGYYEVTDPWRSCANGGITDWSTVDAFGGTSAATPHVSGAAGLILAMNPDLDGEDAEKILIRTAHDHRQYEIGWDEHSGWGRPDLEAALELTQWPYVAERRTGVSGGSAVLDGTGVAVFMNVEGLGAAGYAFQRYRVDETIPLDDGFVAQPLAWGRVQGAIGWRRIVDGDVFDLPGENAGHTSIAAVSSSSITVRTYYYDLYRVSDGGYVGRFPNGGTVRFSFTVIGPAPALAVGDGAVPSTRVLRVVPNPASTWAAIRLPFADRERSPDTRLSIYDASGREVRRFEAHGNSSLVWDLTTGTGRPVAAGVYFLKLEDGADNLGHARMLVTR